METINQTLKDYSYSKRATNSIAIEGNKISSEEADMVIESISDLIDNQDYRPYYYKKLYRYGKGWILGKAVQARKQGENPARYFAHLVR